MRYLGQYIAVREKIGGKFDELQSKICSVVDLINRDKLVISDMGDFLERIRTGGFRSLAIEDPLHINLVPKLTALSLCKRSASAIMQQQLTDRRLGRARMVRTMIMPETVHWRMP